MIGHARTRTSATALLVVAALVVVALLAHSAPVTASRGGSARAGGEPLTGINVTGLGRASSVRGIAGAIAKAHAVGARVVRSGVAWASFEPTIGAPTNGAAVAGLDRIVAAAAADGMRVVLEVDSTPCWASSAPAQILRACVPGTASRANAWPPRNARNYASFVASLAQRYKGELAAIEIWNEPDQANQDYFAGSDKPARYAKLLRAAYPAIKRVDPALPVLAGSIVGSDGSFLKALYAAGIKGYYDGLAVHFYVQTLAKLREIHEVQLANGDYTPLWLDEFGWSNCYPAVKLEQEQPCVTTAVQAQDLYEVVQAIRQAPYVAAAIVYKLQDSRGEEFGVVSTSGRAKPAFSSLRSAFEHPSSEGSVVLRLRQSGLSILASGTAPPADFVALEASVSGVLRYRAFFYLDRWNRFAVRLPAALGTSNISVRVYQYWAGPAHAASAAI